MARKRKRGVGMGTADLIARFCDGFISGEMTFEEGEDIIDRLHNSVDEALPILAKHLGSPDQGTRRAAIVLSRELDDPRVAPALRRVLLGPDCRDEDKLAIIHALDQLGAPLDEATLHRVIPDPEALIKNAMAHVLDRIQDPDQVEAFLEVISQGAPEEQAEYVREMLEPLADRRLLLLLTALLHSEHDDVILATVDAIERLKEPATISLLEERGEYDPSPGVRHAAGNAALRLQMRVGDRPPQPWLVPSALPLIHCWLSTIDGSGGQVLFVTREDPQGDLWMLDLMFNDYEGIKDCFSALVDEARLSEMIDTFEAIDFVDVSLERARAQVMEVYQVTLDARRRLPPPFMVWRGWLDEEDSRSVEEIPLPALEPSRQAELLDECTELLDLEEFEYWFFNPGEVADFVPRYGQLHDEGLLTPGEENYEALLNDAIKAVVGDEQCQLLTKRLRRQAWLLAQLYEDEDVPLWALAAAKALEAGDVVEHPLLRAMMVYSLFNASDVLE